MRGTSAVARLATLLLFLTAVGICAYWATQILAPRPAIAPSGAIGDSTAAVNLAPSTQLFGRAGEAGPQAATPTNIQVTGIAEAGPRGVAILTVDGRSASAYAVNDTVTDGTKLVAVTLDTVTLDQRGQRIDLKAPERASLSVLSSGIGKPRTPSSDAATTPPVGAAPAMPAPAAAPPAGMGGVLGQPTFPAPSPVPAGPAAASPGQPGAAVPGGAPAGVPSTIPPGVTPNQPPGQLTTPR